MLVKVTKTPGPVQEYSAEEGSTVSDVLSLAGISDTDGYRIEVEGETRTLQDEVFNGDFIMVVKQIKGNS